MVVQFYSTQLTEASGSSTTNHVLQLPRKGNLIAVSVGFVNTSGGPVWANVHFGDDIAQQKVVLIPGGFIRTDADVSAMDPLTWQGALSLDTLTQRPSLNVQFRNYSGSTQALGVTWAVDAQ